VGWDVTVTQPWATADRSPRVAFEVTNEAEEERFVGPAFPIPTEAAGGGLSLRDVTDSVDRTFGVWCIDNDGKADGRRGEPGLGPRPPSRLGPGASTTRTVVVLDAASNGAVSRRGSTTSTSDRSSRTPASGTVSVSTTR
jgi:hypothetical protein